MAGIRLKPSTKGLYERPPGGMTNLAGFPAYCMTIVGDFRLSVPLPERRAQIRCAISR